MTSKPPKQPSISYVMNAMNSKSSKLSSFLPALVLVVVFAPVGALYTAWIFSSTWDLLVRPQYGGGPSYAAWYGFSTLFSLAMLPWKQEKDDDDDPTAAKLLSKIFVNSVLMLLILGMAHGVHAILGWP